MNNIYRDFFHIDFEHSVENDIWAGISIGVPVKKNWGGGGHIFARRILKFRDGSKMNQNIV